MISAQGILSITFLVISVEGTSIQQASLQFTNSNSGHHIQTPTDQALVTHGRGLTSNQNGSSNNKKLSSISQENIIGNQQTSALNIVTGTPVNGGAKTPSFEEFILREPLEREESPPKTDDNFIRNVLENASTKANDVEFLHAIQSIEGHLERTVGGSKKPGSNPTKITSTSHIDTPLTSTAVSPKNIIRKFVINSRNEISEVEGNFKSSHTSPSPKLFNSNNKRIITGIKNETRKTIVLVPRNMSMEVLKMHLPQFSSQNLRVAKLVSTTKTGSKGTGNLLVLPSLTFDLNNKSTKKTISPTDELSKQPLINQPTVNEHTNNQLKHLSQQLHSEDNQRKITIVQTDVIKSSLSSKVRNKTSQEDSMTVNTKIDSSQSDFNEQFVNKFSFQRENFPDSKFPSPKYSTFATFSKSTGAFENRNRPLTHSTIQVKEQTNMENPFLQSEIHTDYFNPSLYLGPIQIAQFIKSVQPSIMGDLDIVKAAQVNKNQRKPNSVKSSNNRLNDRTIFEKPSFFESESRAIFQEPFVFNQESFRRPITQPSHRESLFRIDNSRFRDDSQLSHVQPNLELFPEASRFRSFPSQRKQHSSSNGIVSARSDMDTRDLSWFGTNHPGIDLTAFDPHIGSAY